MKYIHLHVLRVNLICVLFQCTADVKSCGHFSSFIVPTSDQCDLGLNKLSLVLLVFAVAMVCLLPQRV